MELPELHIDLARTPSERVSGLRTFRAGIDALFAAHVHDLSGAGLWAGDLQAYAREHLSPEVRGELEGVADIAGRDFDEILLFNLYYDAVKAVLGCSAFAVNAPGGPLHARNLDWYSEGNMLQRHSLLCRFTGGRNAFMTIGWPGFLGALSGVAPGKFAITLNAVLSREPPQAAAPVSFLIRDVLESAESFEAAVARLAGEPIYSDCLLLVSGTRAGELAVIERTPTRAAVRRPGANGEDETWLAVTNDYRALATESREVSKELSATACHRFDRIRELVTRRWPETAADCFEVLSDDGIRMAGTMQQMVLHAATGRIEFRP